jgi:hypothetical protein
MQWPLTSQLHGSVSQKEQLVFSLRIKLNIQILNRTQEKLSGHFERNSLTEKPQTPIFTNL